VVKRHQGRVVDAQGHPLARAFVTVVAGTVPVPELALLTGEDGTFSIGLPDGCFRLRANTADARVGEAEIDWAVEADQEIVIRVG
jgi:hypothetical protein